MAPTEAEWTDAGEGCLSFYPLRTDRLLLQPVAPEHVAAIAALANDAAVSQHTARLPHPYTAADAQRFVEESAALAAAGRSCALAIERRGDRKVLGVVALDRAEGATSAELGYWIGRPYWGDGLATEAARALLAHGFDDLGLTEVTATVSPDNPASARVLEKLGFRATGPTTCTAPARSGGEMAATGYAVDAATFADATRRRLVLVSAVALLDADNRVLLQKRPEGKAMAGLWEFPGGKVNEGESPERALIRELHEELGIDVREGCLAPLAFASHGYETFHLLMPLYVCRQWKGRPTPREGQELAWVAGNKLRQYEMPPADIPLIPLLQEWL